MLTLRAKYSNGKVQFLDGIPPSSSREIFVTFLSDEKTPAQGTVKEFISKWAGAFEGLKIDNLREERIRRVERKHQQRILR